MLSKPSQETIKVGVMIPRSDQYPLAPRHFLNGIKLYFTLNENRFNRGAVDLVIEDIGFGSEQVSNEKAHKLISQDQVVLIAGVMHPVVASFVGSICDMAEIPLINSSLGEAILLDTHKRASVFYNSMQFWQSAYHLGYWAASELQNPIAVVSSWYDSGYDTARAFRIGVYEGGGEIVEEMITHMPDQEDPTSDIAAFLKKHEDCVPFLAYHSRLASDLLKHVGSEVKQPLLLPPIDHQASRKEGHWVAPANSNQKSAEQSAFAQGMQEYLNTEADTFALLGYETGRMIYSAVKHLDKPEDDWQNQLDQLISYNAETLNGKVQVDTDSNTLTFPLAIYSAENGQQQTIVPVKHNDQVLYNLQTDFKSGFLNPYMFF